MLNKGKALLSVILCAIVFLLGTETEAMYAKEKGVNEWTIQNVGVIKDLQFTSD
jgi:hypothetical protein